MKTMLSVPSSAALLLAFSLSGQVVIDDWDMNGNGTWQTSNNGTNLGGHYKNDLTVQQFAQTDNDGVFLFAPLDAGNFGGKLDLSSVSDLTSGIVTLSMTYAAIDWSTTPADNTKIGFRLWDAAGANHVSLSFEDSNDKIFAYTKSSIGDLNEKTGRIINSLADDTTTRTVFLELDYAASEVRMYSDNWQWPNGDPVHTNTVDFASAGMTDVGKFQTFYSNWGAGDTATIDNITVSFESLAAIPEPAAAAFFLGTFGLIGLVVRRRK